MAGDQAVTDFSPFYFIVAFLGTVAALWAIDRWHQRIAWRRAGEEARRAMREIDGVEQGPDGKWRRIR